MTNELMSLEAFYGISWGFFALCVLIFVGRLWIRWISLRKFVVEDLIMFVVLCLVLATAVVSQLHFRYIYTPDKISDGLADPATLRSDVRKGLRGLFEVQIMVVLGLWGVKFNFLLFFYRIFCSVSHIYRRVWWAVFAVTVLCLGAMFGTGLYKWHRCIVSDAATPTECTKPSEIHLAWLHVQVTSAIDTFNDLLIMIFPVAILWRVQISLKKKLYLSLMFMVSLFTIVMAIIRGTVSYGQVVGDMESRNLSWIWFWLQMGLVVSFLVACLVSFRALFTRARKRKPSYSPPLFDPDRPRTFGRTWVAGNRKKRRDLYDSLVNTCTELEGVSDAHASELSEFNEALVLTQVDGKVQADASSSNYIHECDCENYLNEISWADHSTAEGRSVQSVKQAYFQPHTNDES